jgi:hypothetical protein
MSIMTLLVVLLILVAVGGAAPWPQGPVPPGTRPPPNGWGPWHGFGYGPFVPGGLGLIVLILVILLLVGRI